MEYQMNRCTHNNSGYYSRSGCDWQVVAMAYVPVQELDTVYEPDAGFCRGTLFPELDKPFMMAGGCCAHG